MPDQSTPRSSSSGNVLRRVLRMVFTFVIAPILFGALVVLVLATTPWGNERVRRLLVSQANDRLTGLLSIGALRGNLLRSAALTDVSLLDSSHRPVFTAHHVRVTYSLWSALQRRVVLHSLELDTALVVLDQRPGAAWNFQTLMRPSSTVKDTASHSPAPVLEHIVLRHSRLLYRRPWYPDSTAATPARDSQIAAALSPTARRRTEAVAGGYQRVLDYHDLDAVISSVVLSQGAQPTAVKISSLSMVAEPYRPPVIDVRSLAGTLLVSKDSLWWRGARMRLPQSDVSGDGTIGFHRSGFRLDLTGAPVSVADLRWLNPALPTEGGGRLRYAMHLHGDTADFDVTDANVRYRTASLIGHGGVSRISPRKGKSEVFVRGADLTIAGLTTQIIRELAPTVVIKRAGVLGGHIALNGSPRSMLLDADVHFDDALAGLSRVLAKGSVGTVGGFSTQRLDVTVQPLHVATLGAAGVHVPLAGTVTGHAIVTGAMTDGWAVRGDLALLDRGNLSRISGAGDYRVAGKRVVADATLTPLSLLTVGQFAPSAKLQGSVASTVHAEGTLHDVRFRAALRSLQDGGSFDARGSVMPQGARSRYDIALTLHGLNGRRFSLAAPVTRLNGTIAVRGMGTTPATLNATAAADLVRSAYDTFAVERLSTRLSAALGVVHVDTLDVLADGARASASGALGLIPEQTGTLRFVVTVETLARLRRWVGSADSSRVPASAQRVRATLVAARRDSTRRADSVRIERLALGLPEGVSLHADIVPALRRDSIAGRVAASGTLTGSVRALAADVRVHADGVVARGYAMRRLDATATSANIRDSSPAITFSVRADTIGADGLEFQRVVADGTWQRSLLTLGVDLRQDSLVSYTLAGSYHRTTNGSYDGRLVRLRGAFGSLVWETARPSTVTHDHGTTTVDSLLLRSNTGGLLFANGRVSTTGDAKIDFAVDGLRISTILEALQRDSIAEGTVALHAHVTGSADAPDVRGDASLVGARYHGVRAPDVRTDVQYRAQRLSLTATAHDSTGRKVLDGRASLPVDLALHAASGSRRLDGNLEADVVLDSLALATLPFESNAIEGLRGIFVADGHVRGSWSAPSYAGTAALRGGALSLSATDMRVSDIIADLHLAKDTLHLDSLVGRAGGPLRAWGTVDLRAPTRPYFNLSATGQNVRVMDQRRGLVDADADIFAIGPLDALRVTGRGEMRDGFLALKQFRKDLLRVKAPGDLSFLAVFDTSAPPNDSLRRRLAGATKKRMAIIADLSLAVDRGNYYRNRPDANTEFYTGDGEELRVHIDQRTDDQWSVGFVRIGEGVAFFRTRPFTPARGALTFGPYTNAPGIVQQVGERLVWEPGRGWFPLQLLTGGTSKGPAVGLESGTLFPIRGRELNGYLTLGRAVTTLLQQTGSSLSGSESWSGQLSGESGALAHRQQGATALGVVLHDLGTGVTKEYDLDAFSVSSADVPTELVFGKTGGVRGALVEAGRYLTTERYIGGEMRLTSGIPGVRFAQRFGTTYRLDMGVEPRFLFRAPEELGLTHPTVRTGVFGMFLTRFWDF